MTTESPQQKGELDDPFASLSPYQFVLLTTFRKSGVGVPTAMWFTTNTGSSTWSLIARPASSSAFALLVVSSLLPAI
jgi:hypothetical protein